MKNKELRQPNRVENVLQNTRLLLSPTCIFNKQNSGVDKVQDTQLLLHFGRTANDVLILRPSQRGLVASYSTVACLSGYVSLTSKALYEEKKKTPGF